jgi:phage shock protein E
MKKIYALAVLLITVMLTAACSGSAGEDTLVKNDLNTPESSGNITPADTDSPSPDGEAEYHKISAEDAKERMDSGDAVIILDVRTQEEYDEDHIPGAILIPNETIGEERPALLPDLDAEILIYCRSGRRSAEAAKKLVALGYSKVYDFGGIIGWPYETAEGNEKTAQVFEKTGE